MAAGHDQRRQRRRSGSAPTSARRRSATAATCSSRPASRPTRRPSPRSGRTWDDFINFGKQYEASTTKPSGSHFVDSAASIFSTAVYQGDEAYANADGQPDVENSDGVKTAWGYASQAAQDGITAGLQQFTPAWNKAFSSGAFAALACPTWMMGYIQGQAGDAYAGKWDIAPVLPGGATNWGGSWLGVPTSGQEQGRRHRAGRVAVGQGPAGDDVDATAGHFPSNSDAAAAPAVSNAKSAYFSNAPVGQIFGDIAAQMKIPPIGLYDTQIQQALTTQLTNVETKGTSPDDAFNAALDADQADHRLTDHRPPTPTCAGSAARASSHRDRRSAEER